METSTIVTGLASYMVSLDWSYICTFIILCYGVNHTRTRMFIMATTGRKTRTRYRVLLAGLLYGILLYWVRGYDRSHIESLIQSFLFAVVFHKLLLEALVSQARSWTNTYHQFQQQREDHENPVA